MESIRTHGYRFLMSRAAEYFMNFARARTNFLKAYCHRHNVPFWEIDDHNSESCYNILHTVEADVLITANTRIINTMPFFIMPPLIC